MWRYLVVFLLALPVAAACSSDDPPPTTAEAGDGEKRDEAIITTNKGVITLELYPERAPITVENFKKYVEEGFYTGVVFHRVIPNFMIQTGGHDEKLNKKKPRDTIKNEATNGLKNKRYTVAMARTGIIDSATSQFFINVKDNANLDHRGQEPRKFGYAVFGKVIEGMDVVDSIAGVPTHCPSQKRAPCNAPIPRGMGDVPKDNIVIEKIELD
jgi:cyclophilin family peptidyl-prolyl cis-trans isomerase